MRKFLKILKYLTLSVIAFLLALTIIAKLTENAITDFVTEKISQSITAPFTIDDASFTLIRRFPLSTVEFKGIHMGTQICETDSLQTPNHCDTLACIERLYVSVRSKKLFKKKIEIVKIEIKGATLNYHIDTAGISNIDFLIDTTTTEKDTSKAAPLNLALNQLLLKDTKLNYIDEKRKASARATIPEIELSGLISENNYEGKITGDLLFANCSFQETPVNKMELATLKLNLDYLHDSVFIKKVELKTEGANFEVTGNVLLKNKIPGNINIAGTNLELKKLVKYAPDDLLNEIGLSQLDGIFNFNATIQGELADSILPQVTSDFICKNGTVKYLDYPLIENISFKGNATNGFLRNNITTQAVIKTLHFETRQSSGDMSVSVQNLNQLKYKVQSKLDLNLDDFTEFVPDTLIEYMNGNVDVALATEGELPDSIDASFADYLLANTRFNIKTNNVNIGCVPDMKIDSMKSTIIYEPFHLSIKNLKLMLPAYNLKIDDSNLDALYAGSISVPDSMNIKIESMDIKTPESFFRTSTSLSNLKRPTFYTNTHLDLEINEWLPFLPDSLINNLTGSVLMDIRSSGTVNLDSVSEQIMPIIFNNSIVGLNLNKLSLDMPDTLMNINTVSGNISLINGTLNVDKLKGEYMKVPWRIDSTTVENLYPAYFLKTPDTLRVNTRLYLEDINYTAFAPLFATDTTERPQTDPATNSPTENFVPAYEIKGKVQISSVTYGKALLNNISSKFNVKNDLYIADQLKFEGFKGKMNSSIIYSTDENNLTTIKMKNNIYGMDIKKLLYDFDNFHQSDITHENISGLITTETHSLIKMTGDSVLADEIRLNGDFTIENGGIYDYAPLRELPKITSLDELDKIEFKTFNTHVFIIQSGIYVPKTYISSTAFDISAFGMQKFNDDYEYHLQLHLKDLLLGKSKKLLKEQAKLGDEAGKDKRSTRDIISEMKNGKMSTRLDNKDSKNKMSLKIKTQEALLNLKFHPKVVVYDTGVE